MDIFYLGRLIFSVEHFKRGDKHRFTITHYNGDRMDIISVKGYAGYNPLEVTLEDCRYCGINRFTKAYECRGRPARSATINGIKVCASDILCKVKCQLVPVGD